MTSTRQAMGARRATTRLALCAATATLLTLSGTSPAAADPQTTTVTYSSSSDWTGNSYDVSITVTISRTGNHYTIKGKVKSTCFQSKGPDQKWGLAFGSSSESWRYDEGACGKSRQAIASINESGRLGSDGRVYLQAGAYGGEAGGAWGWGTKKSVWV